MVGGLIRWRRTGVDQSVVEKLLSPGFPGDQQQQQPREQQHVGGSSPCQLGHGDEAGEQRRREVRKQSLDGQGSR